ncbi:hypothetical protein [Gottfriedia solisilvae]|uniref:Uncharacterized protein n=1 Tax=Gottfriedia solisilvae TaxID=1516104 RepID=A0A8J3EYH8_9BACI|nr:hypothetical protein [Gottfriedia solisilvae]GGI13909.1 hypothetical protein GCM10007380_20270 [Gottfriedia solisilvae]
MKKKIFATTFTAGIATALVATNGVMTTFAFSGTDAKKVEVIGQHHQISQIQDSPYMASKRTSQDMNDEEAIEIAKKAIEEKFKVSLNGMVASGTFCDRVDMEGTFYFVTFEDQKYTYSDAELIEAKENLKAGREIGIKWNDLYTASVNSKTGEIVEIEKNPTAPEGAN